MIIHTVTSGDNIYAIARQYDVPVSRIITDNMLTNPSRLVVGQDLVILFPTVTHTVRGGETLSGIAAQYGVSLNDLYRNNPQLNGLPQIFPGQTLNIAYETPPFGPIVVNGYAYPFINREVLRRTLPFLTYLSIFSYGFREDGTLFPPGRYGIPDSPAGEGGNGTSGGPIPADADEELIAIAREYGTVPLLTLTSITERGTFSSELAERVIGSPTLSQNAIDSMASLVAEKGYGGVDVDFEYIPADLAGAYADFVRRINERLGEGYTVTVSLAPKTRADQPGLLYGGHDYGGLGAAADYTLLMTYEWGYTYGPPMAVSPINEVRRVLDYAVTEIPRDKILLGTPNYGYDWALPYIRGETKAESLGNVAAVDRALEQNATIRYDETAQAPNYTYYDRPAAYSDAVQHIVWFEDAKSSEAHLRLIQEYGLAGAGIWNIMRYFPALWLVMNQLYEIVKR